MPPTPESLGFDPQRLARIESKLQNDVAASRFDGARVIVARRGTKVLDLSVGFADREADKPMQQDSVFFSFSLAKQFSNVAILQQVERGLYSVSSTAASIAPEFGQHGKQHITISQLLTHRAGMSSGMPPVSPDKLGNVKAVFDAVSRLPPEGTPGERVSYSPTIAHFILAEVATRCDGRTFREILANEVFGPLGMTSTVLGARVDLAPRRVPVRVRDRTPGLFPPEALEGLDKMLAEDTEIPAGGCLTTADDVFRFAEAMRLGGALDGRRVLAPATVKLATTNQTGQMINHLFDYAQARGWPPIPANLGMGFMLRGTGDHPMPFGSLASPGTFGGLGAGSNMFWVDPETQVTMVFLSSGLMEEINNMERLQVLSDMVHASIMVLERDKL